MRPNPALPPLTDFTLPDTGVPELEFSGIRAQYAALKHEIAPRLARVFEHGRFILGPEVEELETALAAFCGARYAISMSSGTDALTAALLAHGIGPGDAVFVPGFTFTATAETVLLLGATPVFVDIDGRTFNVDPSDLIKRLEGVKQAGRLRPRAVIAVDLFGLPADYDLLRQIASGNGMLLIADAAQSFGAMRSGKKAGSLAPLTVTSFFPAKPFGCYGDGGAVFTDDAPMAERLRSIRGHGQGRAKYEVERVGLNARLDTLQAAVLLGKLPAFAGEIAARDRLAGFYDQRLRDAVVTPLRVPGTASAWAQYSILVDGRDKVRSRLEAAGIPSAVYYPKPMHLQPAYASHGGGQGSLPVSEAICGRILSLPMHAYITADTAERITDAVRTAVRAVAKAADGAYPSDV